MPPAGSLKFRLSNSSRSPIALFQAVGFDHQFAQARAGRNVDFVGLVALLEFCRRQFLEALHAGLALGLARLGIGAHPFQFALQGFAQAFLLALFGGEALFLLFQPGGVIALPGNAMAAIQFQDPAGDVVEEVAIVRDRDDGARIAFEETFQPRHRLGVQMVGGLIEQQHVGLRQQQAAQRDATAFAAGNLGHIRVPRRQAQRVGGDFERALQVPAALGVDRILQLGLLFEQLVHFVRIQVGIGELVADRVEAIDQRLHVADAFDDVAAHVLGRIQARFLGQETDLDAGLRARLAVDLLVDARHDAQERGFTRAVQAEHADFRAGKKRQRNVPQDDALGRHHLGDAIHGVDELGHCLCCDGRRGARRGKGARMIQPSAVLRSAPGPARDG